MALLGESLVEEWLNRKGYFTIRGLKHGVGEMDLLAVRPSSEGAIEGWHVEVQISFRPIGYISKLPKTSNGKRRTSAKTRTKRQVKKCAEQWINDKFLNPKKVKIRAELWPDVKWAFHFVHAVVREPIELEVFSKKGIECHSFGDLLAELSAQNRSFSGSAGGDIAEIVSYYRTYKKLRK